MGGLTIYRASAGAGKTFQLTSEYLKLVLSTHGDFRKILAVTFTNKATAEMRHRIVSELYTIAQGQPSAHIPDLLKTLAITETELNKRAEKCLNTILHNYSQFKISTIDSFFQRVIKSFTREVGLNFGFNIELDTDGVVADTIALFIDTITDDPELYQWMVNYSAQKMTDHKGWDIESDLAEFAKKSFKEAFFSLSETELEELSKIDTFKLEKKRLTAIIEEHKKTVKSIGQRCTKALVKYQLNVEDFYYKKTGPVGLLDKMNKTSPEKLSENSYVLKALNSPDKIEGWYSAKKPPAGIDECIANELFPALSDYFAWKNEHGQRYFTSLAILRNLDIFALLVRIYRKLLEYCNQKNIFLLSLATPLLSKMIDESDAPFIYEKTGEYLNHFMIDEFQDTSVLQWQSMFPLVLNSVAQGQTSLVVGDVKQSIYRWRNGDWNLLATVLKQQFSHYKVIESNLPFNWRSAQNIIKFNNALYAFSADNIHERLVMPLTENFGEFIDASAIVEVYKQSEQQIPDKSLNSLGYAEIKFIKQKVKRAPDDVEELEDENLVYTIDTLEKLYANGYQPEDITILVRQKNEGNRIAKCLMEHQKKNPDKEHLFRFTSGDSVFLNASKTVSLIISAIECIVDPKNHIARLRRNYLLASLKGENGIERLVPGQQPENEAFDQNTSKLRAMPLFDMVHHLIDVLFYQNNISIEFDKPFIDALLDGIIKFQKNAESDLVRFLEWWEQKGSETCISMSENQNAIRIMTIHKSKGLEFNAVIIPFAGWGDVSKPNMIWCKPDNTYTTLPIVPLKTSKQLSNTIFKAEFAHEQFLEEIDNLNMLYVATTRARVALFMATAKTSNENGASKGIKPLINAFASAPIATELGLQQNTESDIFYFGTLTAPLAKTTDQVQLNHVLPTHTNTGKLKLNLKFHAPEFFNADAENNSNRLKGKVYHFILEHTKTIGDLPLAVEKALQLGYITLTEKKTVTEQLSNAISHPTASNWFGQNWTVRTEVPILLPNGDIKRPDRVIENEDELIVIDYKFTNRQTREHVDQVLEYKNILKDIESKNVKGYVWYVLENITIDI